MPPDGDMMGLIDNLAALRGRPIKVREQPLAGVEGGVSGLTFALPDADYIVVDAAAHSSRRTAILAHEIAHLMLEHDQGERVTDDLIALAAPDLSPALIERVLQRHSYVDRHEQEAERMATALAAEHERRRRLFEIEGHPVSARLR